MFIIWDTFTNRPWSKDKYGHFTVYGRKQSAQSYIYRCGLKARCRVRELSHIAFVEGGAY